MSDKTMLVLPGRKMLVSRILKRVAQAGMGVALSAAVVLAVVVFNGMLMGRNLPLQAAINNWLFFIKRSEILSIMALTSFVTVLFVYWQRDRESGRK
jgi:uncharacterized membrane protein